MTFPTDKPTGESWRIGNEFATVRVSLDRSGHNPRLVIEDIEHGVSIALDPLILASLARGRLDDLAVHLFPNTPEDLS